MSWKNIFGLRPTVEEVVAEYHTCQFITKNTAYAAPRRGSDVEISTFSEDMVTKILLGTTTILEECVICHKLRKEEILGTEHPQLDEILDNVELYGPQFFQRNNTPYFIQRYQPQSQQTTGQLPIRSV